MIAQQAAADSWLPVVGWDRPYQIIGVGMPRSVEACVWGGQSLGLDGSVRYAKWLSRSSSGLEDVQEEGAIGRRCLLRL